MLSRFSFAAAQESCNLSHLDKQAFDSISSPADSVRALTPYCKAIHFSKATEYECTTGIIGVFGQKFVKYFIFGIINITPLNDFNMLDFVNTLTPLKTFASAEVNQYPQFFLPDVALAKLLPKPKSFDVNLVASLFDTIKNIKLTT